jgi:DNA-binding GntR family transcriptional regulator
MILVGDLRPGQRLTQDNLANVLGVSITPVREALLKLAAYGLVEASPNRYFRVAQTSPEDVRDTFWIHAALAAELARRACERRDDALLESLHEADRLFVDAVEAGDGDATTETNWTFHRLINMAADSPRLLFGLKATLRFIPVEGWGKESATPHGDILAAFDNGDPAAAGAAAYQHVVDAGELLVHYLAARGFWRPQDDDEPTLTTRRPLFAGTLGAV